MTDSEKLDLILSRLDKLEKEITDISLTLENEIRVNISRVAEGHHDLARNLHKAVEISTEKEMMAICLNSLENEICRLKERINQIA